VSFLRGENLADVSRFEGFLQRTQIVHDAHGNDRNWVHIFAQNKDSGWTAEQVCFLKFSILIVDSFIPLFYSVFRFGGLRQSMAYATILVVLLCWVQGETTKCFGLSMRDKVKAIDFRAILFK
jgi:hypothetical protein